MVPKGWINTTFDEHIDCLTGYAFRSEGYSDNIKDIKLLRGDNIEPGRLRWRDARYWPLAAVNELERYHLQKGDFVIALDRTWISAGLKVAEITSSDTPCLLVQRVARIRAKSTLEQGLLRHLFSGHRFEQYVKSVQTATAVPHISPNDIKNFPVNLPPLAEQKKIAQILSTWDQAITITERLLDLALRQKKALMQQLLSGKKRFLGFKGEWLAGHLSDIAKIGKGKALSSKDLLEGDYPVIAGGKTSPYSHRDFTHENAITVSASGAYAGYVSYHPYKIWASDCSVVIAKKSADTHFLFQLLTALQNKIYSLQSGGAQPHIYPKDIESMKVAIPPLEEQKKIAAVLTNSDQKIQTLQSQLDGLKQEKKALMQVLLTGKRHVRIN